MQQKKFNVVMARRADSMLLAHTEFIARVSPATASRLLSEFKKITGRLSDNPYQFPFADGLDVPGIPLEKYRKCMFAQRYKALFLIEENIVDYAVVYGEFYYQASSWGYHRRVVCSHHVVRSPFFRRRLEKPRVLQWFC